MTSHKRSTQRNLIFLLMFLIISVSLDYRHQQHPNGHYVMGTSQSEVMGMNEDCHIRRIIHVLKYPGCVPKSIPSFACQGHCSSYVQVSGSKFWQVERSCMCCQEMGEREATTGIFCPNQIPRFRKIVTRAPVECMCRPCTGIDENSIQPQELIDLVLKKGRSAAGSASSDPSMMPSDLDS